MLDVRIRHLHSVRDSSEELHLRAGSRHVFKNAGIEASGVRHKDCNLSSFLRARLTFSRISEAVAVQMKGLGLSL